MGLVATWLNGIGLSSAVPTFQAAGIVTPAALAELDVAHFEALERDVERLAEARVRADRSALGAGACAGTTLALDREASAKRLGFARVSENSLDAVADRDWARHMTAALQQVRHRTAAMADLVFLPPVHFAKGDVITPRNKDRIVAVAL